MRGRVELPSSPLIDYLDFCRAIAETVCPAGEKGIEGIECIVGKIATFYPPTAKCSSTPVAPRDAEQCATSFENCYSLGEFLPFDGTAQSPAGALTFPCHMTDDDWRLLEKILPDLPPLRYPMSEEERAVFMAAYCAHPSRPAWMPDLVTDVIISRRKAEQAKFIADQHRTMQHEIWTGRLALVNAYHTPVATPMVGAFIPRAQAVAYMERFGIPYLELAGKKVINELIVAQTEPKSSLANEDWRPGERKLSPETQRELVKFHNELKEADQKRGTGKRIPFVKLTAERFGLSRRHVSNIVAAAGGAATKEERIDHLLVGKPQ